MTRPALSGFKGEHARLAGLALALVTLLVYLPVRHYGFVIYDDPEYVTDNRTVQAGLTFAGVKWAFDGFHSSNWHPLTWLSHMADNEWFGLDPGPQHLLNVLFHAANAVLLFALLIRMTGRTWPGAFVAGLFAWHPLHVESVAWIAERKDVLSAMFGLLALHAYVRFAQKTPAADSRRRTFAYFLSLFLFALGLMAKPMLVTLPFVMLLLDYWPLERIPYSGAPVVRAPREDLRSIARNAGKLALEKWPFFSVAAASCVITFLAQRSEAIMTFDQRPLSARVANAVVAYVRYLGKTLWPADLSVIYPLPFRTPGIQIASAVVVLAGLSWFVWRQRRNACFLMGWLWFLGMLVPVIGLVQVGGQAMADRYTYLPLVGVFTAVAYGGADWMARNRWNGVWRAALAAVVLAGCVGATRHQLQYWRDSERLFSHALTVTRDNDIAHLNLGVVLEREGRAEAALEHYLAALRINPARVQVQNNVANLLANMGRREEALVHYREALRLDPEAPLPHENCGTVLVELGRYDEALEQYAEAARLAPEDPRPFYLIGKAWLKQNQSGKAVAAFRQGLRLDPNDVQTLTYLARVLASDSDGRVRNSAEAVTLAVRANELTGGDQPFVLDVLAMAYAEAGQFDQARETTRKAIEIASQTGDSVRTPEMEQRLMLYQSNQPYRAPASNDGLEPVRAR